MQSSSGRHTSAIDGSWLRSSSAASLGISWSSEASFFKAVISSILPSRGSSCQDGMTGLVTGVGGNCRLGGGKNKKPDYNRYQTLSNLSSLTFHLSYNSYLMTTLSMIRLYCNTQMQIKGPISKLGMHRFIWFNLDITVCLYLVPISS